MIPLPRIFCVRQTFPRPLVSDIAECFVSEALLPELETRPGMVIDHEPHEFTFDGYGNLTVKFV